MHCAVPMLGAACLLAAGAGGPGCRSDDPGNCGRPNDRGEMRFCSDDSDRNQVCICSTGRCAESSDNCDYGLRYVYGDQECVPEGELMAGGLVNSADPTAACFDVPEAGAPVELDPGKRVDPRLLLLGGEVLVEAVSPYPVGTGVIDTAAETRAYVRALDWDGRPRSSGAEVDLEPFYGETLAARGAHSWGTCDGGEERDPQTALFAHWIFGDHWQPVLLWARRDGDSMHFDNWTGSVLGSGDLPRNIVDLRVVGTPDGCWVVWIQDPDGDGAEPAVVEGVRVLPDGAVGTSARLFDEPLPARFATAPMLAGDTLSTPLLLAADDGKHGLVAAVPFRNPDDGTVGILARRLAAGTGLPAGADAVPVAHFPSFHAECGGAGCQGIERPEFGGTAAQGEEIYFSYVLVGPSPGAKRMLFVTRVFRDMMAPGDPLRIGELTSPLRGVTLVPRPDGGVNGAVMGWDGNVSTLETQLHLFRLHAEGHAVRALPNPQAFLPQLVPDEGGYLMAQFLTRQSAGNFGLQLVRLRSDDLQPAPTWPDDGAQVLPTGTSIGSDPSSAVAPPLPRPDGGALTAWTTSDLHVHLAPVRAVL
ncbi:MAG: hypothetical protein JXB32_23515 [Deltaproteobacteria bacterium]|nr:hypothetical protein [Deltaproteobacteria bacterium]